MSLHEDFVKAKEQVAASLIERHTEVECLFTGLVAGEHVLLVGEPGTAKSLILRNLVLTVSDAEGFDILMHKFLPPEELVGQVMLSKLKTDEYQRDIEGFLPTATIALLDEIWKSSPAVLNILLTMLNERLFRNGKHMIKCPLRMAVAASNEYPIGDGYETLGALYDRFIIRRNVKPVSVARRRDLMFGKLPTITPCLTVAQIDAAQAAASLLGWNDDAVEALEHILSVLNSDGIRPGDRRMSVGVVQAFAWLNGHAQVEVEDLEILQHCLWDDPTTHSDKCRSVVCKVANPVANSVMEIINDVESIIEPINLGDLSEMGRMAEAVKKMKECEGRLAVMPKDNPRVKEGRDHIRGRIMEVQRAMLGDNAA
mgnify:FL=1